MSPRDPYRGKSALKGRTDSYWLTDLMAGYTVENMSFAPADSLDLERLLTHD